MKVDLQSLTDFEQKFIEKLTHINLSQVFPKIKQVILTSIDRNFREGGRFGNENEFGGGKKKWLPSHRANKDKGYKGKTLSGKTLVDTGQLVASVEAGIKISQTGLTLNIELGSNKDYASLHQFGGKIDKQGGERESKWKATKQKSGKYKYRFAKSTSKTKNTISRKYQVGAYTINIPARPYLVIQNEDSEEIALIIQDFVIKELNK